MAGRRIARTVGRALRLRCPHCGEGAIFSRGYRMNPACAACRMSFQRETGYFVGAMYINFGLTVLFVFAGYFLLDLGWAWPVSWQLGLWCPVVVFLPVLTFRHSKALWLALDHLLDPVDGRTP